jgi:hypothetical protein
MHVLVDVFRWISLIVLYVQEGIAEEEEKKAGQDR